MDKRIVLVLLFLASIKGLVGLNWGLLHATPAQTAVPQAAVIMLADEDGGVTVTAVPATG